jgi:transcriptional regulator with XRE-family HTH domain
MDKTRVNGIPTWTLADRLRKARELTGLDQGAFAELAGISRTTVTNYEHGKRAPRRLYLRAWAEAAHVDVAWLSTGQVTDQATSAAA